MVKVVPPNFLFVEKSVLTFKSIKNNYKTKILLPRLIVFKNIYQAFLFQIQKLIAPFVYKFKYLSIHILSFHSFSFRRREHFGHISYYCFSNIDWQAIWFLKNQNTSKLNSVCWWNPGKRSRSHQSWKSTDMSQRQ